ncbi:MAG TPA: metallopeptidase TldD-related protein [Bryobacteraceae bacterium]|nr:metallopeptidase TldD-related protein [Bryobacteraceae bacterium]HPT26583.1 metallopeptidase TldD-related protein [Bryobacteraceae bacterium]
MSAPANRAEEIAARLIKLALEAGATEAEAGVAEGDEFECTVRLGELETLKEAGSSAAGVRVFRGKRTGTSSTSDLSEDGLRRTVASAMALAEVSMEDPFAGLPLPEELGAVEGDMALLHPGVEALDPAERIAMARRAEKAALDFDPRITNSEGGSYGSSISTTAFANSLGFIGSYKLSSCSLSVVAVAGNGEGKMERDYWYDMSRSPERLESAESIGRKAAEWTLRRLDARKAATQRVPVVFDPRVARSLVGHMFSAVTGEAVYHKSSYLAEKLGELVASSSVTIIDDALMPGGFGSSPFDDEGVPSRRTTVVSEGRLETFLLNTYMARKLGMRTTGNASRGLAGNPGTGHGNLYIEAGARTPEELISSVENGFYVTELLGSGVNIVNGDYSRGASGVWIEKGRLTWPVHEVTVSGNLAEIWTKIEAVGSNLVFRGSVASPTLLIGEMRVSGT